MSQLRFLKCFWRNPASTALKDSLLNYDVCSSFVMASLTTGEAVDVVFLHGSTVCHVLQKNRARMSCPPKNQSLYSNMWSLFLEHHAVPTQRPRTSVSSSAGQGEGASFGQTVGIEGENRSEDPPMQKNTYSGKRPKGVSTTNKGE